MSSKLFKFKCLWLLPFLFGASIASGQSEVRLRLLKIEKHQSAVLYAPQMRLHEVLSGRVEKLSRLELRCQSACALKIDQGPWRQVVGRYILQGEFIRQAQANLPSQLQIEVDRLQIQVIGKLLENDYLKGVVAAEMPVSWSIEALKAQAVIARSYLKATQRERRLLHYDVDASTADQAYQSVAHLSEEQQRKLESAVEQTEGEFLQVKGLPYKAFFHADCGGRTTLPSQVWGEGSEAPTKVVTDSYCFARKSAQWRIELAPQELAKKIGLSEVQFIKVQKRSAHDGRVLRISFFGQNKEIHLSGQEFRQRVGFTRVQNTLFSVQKTANKWVFQGQGRGHGVGLCQMGAKMMALEGANYWQILEHYYPREVVLPQDSLVARSWQTREPQRRPTLLE